MKILLGLIALVACTPVVLPNYPSGNITASNVTVQGYDSCDASLWSHVYNPERLQVLKECEMVTGTIIKVRSEADGDKHIQLKLDSQYEYLLNEKNVLRQNATLVLEPICVGKVSQEDAKSSCVNFSSSVLIPKVGQHVRVMGSYVLDTAHGWNEIHPVSSIMEEK